MEMKNQSSSQEPHTCSLDEMSEFFFVDKRIAQIVRRKLERHVEDEKKKVWNVYQTVEQETTSPIPPPFFDK
jgi:hypothetical protein